MARGYYIKKDNKDGLTLNVKKEQFIEYLQGLSGDWLRFKIYERDQVASNGLNYNMELIERKSEQGNSLPGSKQAAHDSTMKPGCTEAD